MTPEEYQRFYSAVQKLMTAVAEALIDNAVVAPYATRLKEANEKLFAQLCDSTDKAS